MADSRPKKGRPVKRWGAILRVTAAICVVAAATIIWLSLRETPVNPGMQEFFTVDDGATWFADDGTRIAPFDHNGRSAVLAKLYSEGDSKPFVAYLMKFSDDAKKRATEAKATGTAHVGPSAVQGSGFSGLLVKRPGDKEWIPAEDPRAAAIQDVIAPDGSRACVPVRP